MKKWIVKLDEHIDVVQEVVDGYYKIYDVDGNELKYDEVPDYMLENHFYKERGCHAWYFYPKYFSKSKEDYLVIYGLNNVEEVLGIIKKDFKVDILSIKQLKNGKI